MKTVCKFNKCNGCMACFSKCPKKCIKVVDNIDSMNAVIDESICIGCKICESVCPNVSETHKCQPIDYKQGWAVSDIRKSSSSGGAASAIIKSFIKNGGFVASCLFKEGDFLFDITNDENVAKKFSGSKYVKSNPIGIYDKIQECLKNNKVLFIGLPCQVAALKNYIKNQKNLYTIDLICHGTPSIKLLNKFVSEEGYNLKDLTDIKFRDKLDFGISVNDIKLKQKKVMDSYLCSFLKSIDYTENCYSCKFATIDRVSDITLGDSWGTEYINQEKNGVSLILIQSNKGMELLKKSNINLKNVDLRNAINHNHQLSHPSTISNKRDKFFRLIKNGKTFNYATFVVLPKMIIKQKVKSLLIKIHIMKV